MNPTIPRLFVVLAAATSLCVAAPQPAQVEFFEKHIRPALAEHCYACHNSTRKAEGALALDHRDGLLKGGDSGPAVVPGRPEASLLLRLIRHEEDERRMPADGPRLDERVISAFATWIKDGAYDPRDTAPDAASMKELVSWEAIRERRMEWWSLQPIGDPTPPGTTGHPIDRFITERLRSAGLSPTPRASRRVLIRRVTFALTGLPPTPDEVDGFLEDTAPDAYVRLVDRLMASPRFGERWARHWMDWLRYADSHGSEGDPNIANAWRYRDYLIRALNQDVPFHQLVREHVAGDLLPDQRVDREAQVVESVIGASQYRLVQHGFAPTDALEERVRFVDNQIDALTKAFLGLTVSCARCHDHKFDPISQADYYALYGSLADGRPTQLTVDTTERLHTNRAALNLTKDQIQDGLAEAWMEAARALPGRLADAIDDDSRKISNPLRPFARMAAAEQSRRPQTWDALLKEWRQSTERLERRRARSRENGWDLAGGDHQDWVRYGTGLADGPSAAGAFHVRSEGEEIVSDILPAGVYSHLLTDKHNGVLSSPRFPFDMDAIFVRVSGDGGSKARYVVHGYPRGGTVYPIHTMNDGRERWVRWNPTYWKGDHGYVEISTAADQAVEVNPGATRSWFGISEVVFVDADDRDASPRDEVAEFTDPLFKVGGTAPPASLSALADRYAEALASCIRRWGEGTLSDSEARFLGAFVRMGLLPITLQQLPQLGQVVREHRRLEAEIPAPRRTPGQLDPPARDHPLFVQGDHKQPGQLIPRRFLECIDPSPYAPMENGRRRLASDFVREDNPLPPRVAVNRVWAHLFGTGLVATPDNFGRLGEPPSHPALLDWLAHRFVRAGWSLKTVIRDVVLSQTFQAGGGAPSDAATRDPENRLLSHFPLRRLEAEPIRDALLQVAGRLDLDMEGPPVAGDAPRRSVYVRVKRNNLDPFLSVFDAPEPHTTRGRRDATNVPAQSLTMLNDPFVAAQAEEWAATILEDQELETDGEKIDRMFLMAFGRPASDQEEAEAVAFIEALLRGATRLSDAARRLEREAQDARAEAEALSAPVRDRLLAAQRASDDERPPGPTPMASWEFDQDLRDSMGDLHGEARGTARLVDGALLLDGRGHVITGRLPRPLRAKTLEVLVTLSDLGQRGGGAMSVESVGGGLFDSIVFGEQESGHWLAGSNHFQRTRPLRGSPERTANERPVHMAIAYDEDGTIRAYRDGRPYGTSYRSDGPLTFNADDSVVVFGLRHSPASDGRRLRGRIHRARLHDRALSEDEVRASAHGGPFVSREQLLAAMSAEQRAQLTALEARARDAASRRAAMSLPKEFRVDRRRAWKDLAQCLLSMKEFIYIR